MLSVIKVDRLRRRSSNCSHGPGYCTARQAMTVHSPVSGARLELNIEPGQTVVAMLRSYTLPAAVHRRPGLTVGM